MKLRINEGDYTLFANDYDYNHYTDFEDMHTIYDDDHYDFKELGLTTVEEVANFYKKVLTYQICSREMLLADLAYNIRKGYWKSSDTPKLLDILDNDPSFEFTVFPLPKDYFY